MKKILIIIAPVFILLVLVACHKDHTPAKPNQFVDTDFHGGIAVDEPPGTVSYSTDDTSSMIYARSSTGYGPIFYLIMPKLTGTGAVAMKYVGLSVSALDRYKGYGLTGTITEYGPVGGYISGTYSGMVRINDANFDIHPDNPMSGNFHVKRTQ